MWLVYRQAPCLSLNPFTAPACNISGLKDARTRLQTVNFPVYATSASNAMSFDENRFTSQCEKEDTILKGLKFRAFIGCSQVTSRQ